MPWPSKTEKPKLEDLVEGLTGEELKAQLKAGAEAKEELTKVNTQLNSLAETLKRIEEKPAPIVAPKKEVENAEPREFTSILEDEDAAFNERLSEAQKPILAATLTTRAHQVYSDVKSSIVEKQVSEKGYSDFKLFEEEIKMELGKAPLGAQCKPEFVQNVYSVVRGRHTDEILRDAAKREGKYFMEGSQPSSVSGGGNKDKDKPQLTDDEKKYADKFGIKHEDYIKSKGELKYV